MVSEVVTSMVTDPDGLYVDGTVGEGGHAGRLLEVLGPEGRVIGIDRDPEALAVAGKTLAGWGARVRLLPGNFRELPNLVGDHAGEISGILLDLGLRSSALDDPARGFAFQSDGPLDMRFNPAVGESASQLLRRIREAELVRILEGGTTRAHPRRLARAMLTWRRRQPLQTTGDLTRCLRESLGRRATPKLLSSVFSALRMEVNAELEDLDRAMCELPGLLRTGGVLCVIAYQSQEDRRVKALRRATPTDPRSGGPIRMEPLQRKPLRPTDSECRRNRRARSARLRAYRRVEAAADS